MDFKTMTYIQSATEFNRASLKGFWETLWRLITRRNVSLLSLDQTLPELPAKKLIYRGLQDIALEQMVGSAGRHQDFTPHFLPSRSSESSKDRWRIIYTLVVTGEGFPPVNLYKVGNLYFVEDGHHRVSVANYLKWPTIQAYVTEISLSEAQEASGVSEVCLATGSL